MKAVRAKGSFIERRLMKALWSAGFRYRKHVRSIYGTPDLAFIGRKVVVFCDSEFWHGKDWERRKHDIKSNRDFWFKKIERNIERDREVNSKLESEGWTVLRFWGKEIEKDLDRCVCDIVSVLQSKAESHGPI